MSETPSSPNFIRRQIDADLASGKHRTIVTRFPPEPNGYLHIGHAKSIWLNFGIAGDYGGQCTLRFDDTNPVKEDAAFAAAIREDVRWLGYQWSRVTHASDYFDELHGYAVGLIEKGLAYADSQSADEIRANRGTLSAPGKDSRYRERSVAENLTLFAGMKNGEFDEGEMVLRAKIDMASPNLNLRDPVLYRIRRRRHQRSGDQWCIYPLYDFTHGQSDAIEGVTHSLCTLEFEDHRALYDWFLDNIETLSRPQEIPSHSREIDTHPRQIATRPRQIEFSRLNLNHTVMSKRLLTQLVDNRDVSGWDDPRMPTICGLRRRGFTPESIRRFIGLAGVTRKTHVIEMSVLENCVREELDPVVPRAMAVVEPLKLVIENYPEGESETIEVPNHPADPTLGTRTIRLSREVYIERDDFREEPPKKFFRLGPGREVRLRYAFVVRCTGVTRDARGRAVELRCQYDPDTRHGVRPDGRKVKGIIHWVNAEDGLAAELRLYDRLFSVANPLIDKNADFREFLNPQSLSVCGDALVEASLANPDSQTRYQFERLGYFFPDGDSAPGKPVFNRIVTLRDSWAKNLRGADVRETPRSGTGGSDASGKN